MSERRTGNQDESVSFAGDSRERGARRQVVESHTHSTADGIPELTQGVTRFEYDDRGRVLVERRSFEIASGLDEDMQREAQKSPLSHRTSVDRYAYDDAGHVLEQVTTYEPKKERGFLSKQDQAFRAKRSYSYDDKGRLVRQVFAWKRMRASDTVAYESGWTRDFEYQGDETVPSVAVSVGDASGTTMSEYTYDANGRKVLEVVTADQWGKPTVTEHATTYDANGRVARTTETYDANGATANISPGRWEAYTYGEDGNVSEILVGYVGQDEPFGVNAFASSADGKRSVRTWTFGGKLMRRTTTVSDAHGNAIEEVEEYFGGPDHKVRVQRKTFTY